MVGHTMVRPCSKLQLLYFSALLEIFLDLERSNAVSGQLLYIRNHHGHRTVHFRASRRPVLVALNSRSFFQLGHHDNGGRFQIPTHSPKIAKSFRQWSLSSHVSVMLSITVAVVGVDVIGTSSSVFQGQYDATVIIRNYICIPKIIEICKILFWNTAIKQ